MPHKRPRPQQPDPLQRRTSAATYAAARAVLTDPRHGWAEEKDFRLRPTIVSADHIIIAALMEDPSPAPGHEADVIEPLFGPLAGELRRTKWAPQREALREAGWTVYGDGVGGALAWRPADRPTGDADDATALATSPAGAPVRLLAIAAEADVTDAQLEAAVRALGTDVPAGRPERLACLYQTCVSEAAFRALLRDITP
ncbi:hypothetical protein [Streptomyces sp. NPDC096153]|uniref:hypothetical protein n=1 Tax=Streptomyces sp. NPDC096153 TaxID=3155548 RepID=UPI0033292C22